MISCPERGDDVGSDPSVRGSVAHAWNIRRLTMLGHIEGAER